ncbi:unnamed protein product, partial [marine sediment metagenome]
MMTLGIDTILNTISVSIIKDNKVLVNKVIHRRVGEYKNSLLKLSVTHAQEIGKIISSALKEARLSIKDIILFAVNNEGSLFSNVIIGAVAANILSQIYNKPVIAVKHDEAHIFSNWIERNKTNFNFPIVVFSASGAHTLV